MIELTDEMYNAFRASIAEGNGYWKSLTAVIALVERDQRAAAERGWTALQQCPSDSPTDGVSPVLHCEREAGHDGAHGAMCYLTSWRNEDGAR